MSLPLSNDVLNAKRGAVTRTRGTERGVEVFVCLITAKGEVGAERMTSRSCLVVYDCGKNLTDDAREQMVREMAPLVAHVYCTLEDNDVIVQFARYARARAQVKGSSCAVLQSDTTASP